MTQECIEAPYQYINLDERCPDPEFNLKPGYSLDILEDCQAEEVECTSYVSQEGQDIVTMDGSFTRL